MDKQLEEYRYKKYRNNRVRFYILMGVATVLYASIFVLYLIKKQPIDTTNIEKSGSAIEAVQEEYGERYIKNLENVPTINYESHYKALKGNYIDLIHNSNSQKEKNREALNLIAFVEYVQDDAVNVAQGYSLKGLSLSFYEEHINYIEEHGEVFSYLPELLNSHESEDKQLSEEELQTMLTDLDNRMELYTEYLTSLKNTKGVES